MFNSIKTKITLGIILIILAVGTTATAFVFTTTRENSIKREKEILQSSTQHFSDHISQFLNNSQLLVESIANNEKVVNLLSDAEQEEDHVDLLENNFLDNFNIGNMYLSIYLMDSEGNTLISTDETFTGNNYSFRDYFTEAMAEKPCVDIAIGVTSEELGYYFSHPVKNKNGKVIGVAVVKLNPIFINKLFADNYEKNQNNYMFVDKHGIVIFSQDSSRILKSLGPIIDEMKRELVSKKVFLDKEIQPLGYGEIQNEIETIKDAKIFNIIDNYDDEEEIIAVSKINNTSFFILRETELEEIIAIATQLSTQIATFVGAAVLLTIILVPILIANLSKPLKKIISFTKLVGKGDFSQKLDENGPKELNDISVAFNTMTQLLKKGRDEIEAEVKERTFDLKKFKLAVENSTDGIVITDANGIILFVNKAMEKITQFSTEEILGKKAGSSELWGGIMGEEFYQKLWKTIKIDKKNFIGEIKNKKKNGVEYVSATSISPILDKNNKVILFVAVEKDVTEANEISEIKSDFINLTSHQLRTPLSAMRWFVEMLVNKDLGELSKEQNEVVEKIGYLNKEMIELINTLINISKVKDGKIDLSAKNTNLNELFEKIVKEMQPLINNKKQKLIVKIDENLPNIFIDPELIKQAYSNLILNAIKYSPENSTISIIIERKNNEVVSQIKDSGVGIPKKDHEKIFSKFFRASNATKTEANGNGLGLFLVKTIIESSLGKVWFESEEGKGTTFWISLPISSK